MHPFRGSHSAGCCSLHHGPRLEIWRSMPVTLRRCLFDRQACCYYTNGPRKNGLPSRSLGEGWSRARGSNPVRPVKSRVHHRKCLHAESGGCRGVAPLPPVLQTGALLRELCSQGQIGREDTTRTCSSPGPKPGGSTPLPSSRKNVLVPMPGSAPGPSAYQAGALLIKLHWV